MESASIRAHQPAVGNGGKNKWGVWGGGGGGSRGDGAPWGCVAFALTTFVLSMFNAGGQKAGEPVGLGWGWVRGDGSLAGMWEFRTGNGGLLLR